MTKQTDEQAAEKYFNDGYGRPSSLRMSDFRAGRTSLRSEIREELGMAEKLLKENGSRMFLCQMPCECCDKGCESAPCTCMDYSIVDEMRGVDERNGAALAILNGLLKEGE